MSLSNLVQNLFASPVFLLEELEDIMGDSEYYSDDSQATLYDDDPDISEDPDAQSLYEHEQIAYVAREQYENPIIEYVDIHYNPYFPAEFDRILSDEAIQAPRIASTMHSNCVKFKSEIENLVPWLEGRDQLEACYELASASRHWTKFSNAISYLYILIFYNLLPP
jgi:hypothetical protein